MSLPKPSGIYIWKLDTTKVQLEGSCYTSPIFQLLGYSWLLKFYPEHNSAPGNATTTLYLVDLPPSIAQITVRRKIHIFETNTISDQTKTFKDSKGQGWPKNTLMTKEIRKMKKFTFKIEMSLLSKYSKDGKKYKLSASNKATDGAPHDGQAQTVVECDQAMDDVHEHRLNTLSVQMKTLMKSMKDIQRTLKSIQTQINHQHHPLNEQHDEKENEDPSKCKNLRIEISEYKPNAVAGPAKSDRDDFKQWVDATVKLPEYYELLVENGVDTLDVLHLIDNETLHNIGITKVGHVMKILNEIKKLHHSEGVTMPHTVNLDAINVVN